MNRQRMKHFIQVMRDVQAHDKKEGHSHFDMIRWYRLPDDGNTCGTVACALGWLALSPEANAEGLHMSPIYREPVFQEIYCGRAGTKYLELDDDIGGTLFYPDGYTDIYEFKITPQQVIDRLQYLLTVGEKQYLKQIEMFGPYAIPGGSEYNKELLA